MQNMVRMDEDSGSVDRHWLEFSAGTSNTIILCDKETTAARELLMEAQHDLASLDLEILRLRTIIKNLNAQREAIVARANRFRTSLTPLKRVPPEVLADIFCLSTDGKPFKLPLDPTKSWPWPLRRVCSRWRQVAISDRRLWSSTAVHVGRSWTHDIGCQFSEIVDTVCGPCNSRKHPWTMEIHSDSNAFSTLPDFPANQHPMVYLVTPFLPRLRNLKLSFPASWFSHLFDMSPSHLALIEGLCLECQPDESFGMTNPWSASNAERFVNGLQNTYAFTMAKNLRMLKISSRLQISHLEEAALPWNQLVNLDLVRLKQTIASVVSILRQSPRLVICGLRTDPGRSEFTTNGEIVLSDLRSITLHGYGHEHLFAYLVAPSLSEIRILASEESSITEISSMLSNFGSSLQVFEYQERHRSYQEESQVTVDSILQRLPGLIEFDSFLDFPVSTLERISRGELLPRLQVLKCSLLLGSIDAFLDAVESRLQNHDPSRAKLHEVCGRLLGDFWWTSLPEPVARRVERIKDMYGIRIKLAKDYNHYNLDDA
ncbi:hypothetical protein Hypma_002940 [Hypsizygus marmoreus]|uniref:Uncharacterized protein n=1 Tax=Hypsizygus marmoreus TaxID=39966 RepID=A0A369J2Y2_HYPMA|nr:hypothetical protein Hypma_002940 [Hypsizygus marmoreus]